MGSVVVETPEPPVGSTSGPAKDRPARRPPERSTINRVPSPPRLEHAFHAPLPSKNFLLRTEGTEVIVMVTRTPSMLGFNLLLLALGLISAAGCGRHERAERINAPATISKYVASTNACWQSVREGLQNPLGHFPPSSRRSASPTRWPFFSRRSPTSSRRTSVATPKQAFTGWSLPAMSAIESKGAFPYRGIRESWDTTRATTTYIHGFPADCRRRNVKLSSRRKQVCLC